MKILILTLLASTACMGLEPDVGPLLAGTCDNSDGDPDTDVSFTYDVQPLLTRAMGGCSCHTPASSSIAANFDVSSLPTMRRGGATSGNRIVVDGEPCASVLYQKVSDTPPFGSRMPLGNMPLTPEEVELVHDWIAEGAKAN